MKMTRRSLLSGAVVTGAVTYLAARAEFPLALAERIGPDLASDPRRPQFHLLPTANWMNDPNAPVYWKGRYHMFYQYNPNGAFWGDMHWAHAVSPDMVHWTHFPVALSPTPGGSDAGGCFSGTAVVQEGVVTALYTGVVSVPEDQATLRDGQHSFQESQCLATAVDPELRSWSKLPKPVIAAPPPGMKVTGFRDPSPWRSGEWWYMVVGSGIPNQGGAVLLYRSRDLRKWEYLHVLASGAGKQIDTANQVDSGDMWECPDIFLLDGQHVLIYSTAGKSCWESGELDPKEMVFHRKHSGVLDYGSFYAPKTQRDRSGQRILWGWIPETRPLEEYRAAGWAGMMSLPRVLNVSSKGNLSMRVFPKVGMLRKDERVLAKSTDEKKNRRAIERLRLRGCCGEITCSFASSQKPFAFTLLLSPATTSEDVLISIQSDPAHPGHVLIDGKSIPIHVGLEDQLDLHMYVDGSVVELMVNQQAAYTKRFYYSGARSPEIALRVEGKTANIIKLAIWQFAPISPNRLTT